MESPNVSYKTAHLQEACESTVSKNYLQLSDPKVVIYRASAMSRQG
jgi:hypothetical protein